MEEIGSFWTYQEVWQMLLYTTKELETVKMEANEQMRKHRDDVKQLIELLNAANKERDDLKNILNKLMSCNNNNNFNFNYNSPESPLCVLPINKANSSITESNSLSDSIDAVTSPDSSNTRVNFAEFRPISNARTRMDDPIDIIVDIIAKGKTLPKKGKLLDAVTETGPLLQTLLVAGPLPPWRNPPPLPTLKIPPVSIKGCESSGARKASYGASSSQMCSSSVLSFSKRQILH